MRFTYDLENTMLDEYSATIKIPILTDVEPDYEWASSVAERIEYYNKDAFWSYPTSPPVSFVAQDPIFYLKLFLMISHDFFHKISQDFLDVQKNILNKISEIPNSEMENRIYQQELKKIQFIEKNMKASELVKELKGYHG